MPFAWAIDTSLKPEAETTLDAGHLERSTPDLDAYTKVLGAGDILRWYFNRFVISTLVTALAILFCSMAGYALLPLRFRGSQSLSCSSWPGIIDPGPGADRPAVPRRSPR